MGKKKDRKIMKEGKNIKNNEERKLEREKSKEEN